MKREEIEAKKEKNEIKEAPSFKKKRKDLVEEELDEWRGYNEGEYHKNA